MSTFLAVLNSGEKPRIRSSADFLAIDPNVRQNRALFYCFRPDEIRKTNRSDRQIIERIVRKECTFMVWGIKCWKSGVNHEYACIS